MIKTKQIIQINDEWELVLIPKPKNLCQIKIYFIIADVIKNLITTMYCKKDELMDTINELQHGFNSD
jgi:hypothetical protein